MGMDVSNDSVKAGSIAAGVGAATGYTAKKISDGIFRPEIKEISENLWQRELDNRNLIGTKRNIAENERLIEYFNNYKGPKNTGSSYARKLSNLYDAMFYNLPDKYSRIMSYPTEMRKRYVTEELAKQIEIGKQEVAAITEKIQKAEQSVRTFDLQQKLHSLCRMRKGVGFGAAFIAGLVTSVAAYLVAKD